MILLNAENLTKHFTHEPVLSGVSFEIRSGDRIGLIGPNGTGKTTLLRILAGLEESDAGQVTLHATARLAYLEQHPTFEPGNTLWQEAETALSELARLAHDAEAVAEALSQANDPREHDRLAKRFDHLQHELEQKDAFHLDHRIERVLQGLGFRSKEFRQPVEQLSGGQQNRLLLAKLLLEGADVMLLDEPSNHLDLEATQWLEDYLAECRRALLVVSHDRYFLDKVTNRTLELFHATVDGYTGNFSAYWRQKEERLKVQKRTYQKQQEFIAKTKDFIRRNKYGQKHAQAADREKKLERLEPVALPREIAAPAMGFGSASRTGDVVLRAAGLSKRYERTLFSDVTFDILRGQRWGILGPNGSGKTTLLRVILDQVPSDSGSATLGTGVKIGYYDQQLQDLSEDEEVVEAVRPDGKQFSEQERRDILARFGITDDAAFQRVGSLSGGERGRAALARVAAGDPNFLIFDEPTNHLDLWARDALERSLAKFEGTVLFVSHDRYFLNQVAERLLVVEPDRFRVIEGNYETYLHFVRQGLAEDAAPKTTNQTKTGSGSAKKERSRTTQKPKRRFPYRKLADIEAEIHQRESQREALEASLGTEEVFRDGDRMRAVKREMAEQKETLEKLYDHWEEAAELDS